MKPEAEERGSGTVNVLFVMMILLALMAGSLTLVRILNARHTADAAADLAALAATRAADAGQPGCTAAKSIAEDNGAQMGSCRMDAAVATVETQVVLELRLGRWIKLGDWTISARARAAPVSYLQTGPAPSTTADPAS